MFQGYSDETFEFFMALAFNNNTEFFHANHDWYVRALRGPSLALASELGEVIGNIDPELERRPDRVVSRINRDVRFSRDKSPYRTYLWLSYHRLGEERSRSLEFWFDISAERAGYGLGMYLPNKPMFNALRRALSESPKEAEDLLKAPLRRFVLGGEHYKRMVVPESVPTGLRELYTVRTMGFHREIADFDRIKSPALAKEIAEGYELLAPFYRWFNRLTPIEDPE